MQYLRCQACEVPASQKKEQVVCRVPTASFQGVAHQHSSSCYLLDAPSNDLDLPTLIRVLAPALWLKAQGPGGEVPPPVGARADICANREQGGQGAKFYPARTRTAPGPPWDGPSGQLGPGMGWRLDKGRRRRRKKNESGVYLADGH
jgi:hypothetical protein